MTFKQRKDMSASSNVCVTGGLDVLGTNGTNVEMILLTLNEG